MTTDRETLVNALRPVLCNALSYPRAVAPHVLGQDMGPLLAAVASAVLASGPTLAKAWDEGRASGIADVDTTGYGGIADTPNPYRTTAPTASRGDN